jgi:hypothetical protein
MVDKKITTSSSRSSFGCHSIPFHYNNIIIVTMVKIETTSNKRKPKWDCVLPQSTMGWINIGAWLLSMLLWWTTPPQVVIHNTPFIMTSDAAAAGHTSTATRTTTTTPEAVAAATTASTEIRMTSNTPPVFLVQSFTKGHHDPTQQRTVLSFTTVPSELPNMVIMIQRIVSDAHYNVFDAIHINIPWTSLRFQDETFPPSLELLDKFPTDPRIIVNRLMDYGPMTRYFGALGFEQHPETRMIVYDIDSDHVNMAQLQLLLRGVNELDPQAIWCNFGEDFKNIHHDADGHSIIQPHWGTYPSYLAGDLSWNLVYFCRGARGILIQPKHFSRFVLNATDYHASCFWDDDRFISFQMGVLGFERKNIHTAEWYINNYVPEFEQKKQACRAEAAAATANKKKQRRRRLGTLSAINNKNKPDIHCTRAYLKAHPHLFPLASNATALCPTS